MSLVFAQPTIPTAEGEHHATAAAGNAAVAEEAISKLRDALSGTEPIDRLLLKAAAGAGKSYVLKRLVVDAVEQPTCARVAIVAFTNKQTQALAGAARRRELGQGQRLPVRVKGSDRGSPRDVVDHATVVTTTDHIPPDCKVVIATCHKLGAFGERQRQDELSRRRRRTARPLTTCCSSTRRGRSRTTCSTRSSEYAPITVGVGDVGQLPPLEAGANPWRGDPGYNPFRAWPTDFDDDARTWTRELPGRVATERRAPRTVARVLPGVGGR